mmetsp:Transcript_8336/g.12610  ORF Transcript_8336/g.12610 Transcript_8336/m.12610 type:complete len:223 (+) Transcript_8336:117-785(+)
MSTKTKRMSAEEKRKVITGLYHTSKDVYTEKEIVSLATKAGVNANSIIDINQSLCDDNLVDTEKIGGSKYFWSFPAKADRMRQLEHEETVRKIEVLGKDIVEAEVKLADAKRGREEEEEGGNGDGGEEGEKPMTRAAKMARRSELVKSVAEKTAELDKLKENDPQAIADLEKELKLVTEAATRWTDNVFACQEYMVKKRGMVKKEVNKMIGITDAFDYPDSK